MTTSPEQTKQWHGRNGHYPTGTIVAPVDRFLYDWYTVAEVQPDGSTREVDLPLTQADFLDPQVGDPLV